MFLFLHAPIVNSIDIYTVLPSLPLLLLFLLPHLAAGPPGFQSLSLRPHPTSAASGWTLFNLIPSVDIASQCPWTGPHLSIPPLLKVSLYTMDSFKWFFITHKEKPKFISSADQNPASLPASQHFPSLSVYCSLVPWALPVFLASETLLILAQVSPCLLGEHPSPFSSSIPSSMKHSLSSTIGLVPL